MAELKTKQTAASVEAYLDTIEDPRRRADCAAISALMKRVTKFEPKMWGPSIVGFGSYHYRYKTGKVCVYIRRLANVDLKVLETLVARSVAETKRRYPKPNGNDA